MNTFLSILFLLIGVATLIYTYKNSNPKKDNSWDKSMNYRGYLGGILFIIIGIVKLLKSF